MRGFACSKDLFIRGLADAQSITCVQKALSLLNGLEWLNWTNIVSKKARDKQGYVLPLLDDVESKTYAAVWYIRPGCSLPFIHSRNEEIYGCRVLRGGPIIEETSQVIVPLMHEHSTAAVPLIEPSVRSLDADFQIVRRGVPGVAHRFRTLDNPTTIINVRCVRAR